MLSADQEKEIKEKVEKQKSLQKKLHRKIGDAKRSKNSRRKRKEILQKLIQEHPETMKTIRLGSGVGRPRLEDSQPLLLETITEIALYGSAAHERRQSEVIRSIKTIDELAKALRNRGFEISRSGIYLRTQINSEGIEINANGLGSPDAVGCSGPTYIAIRSGKHASSTAFSHSTDIEKLMEMPHFDKIAKCNGIVKPVFIITVDDGPDENPRYEKVIKTGIHHFVEFNLDALFIATNAPGRSAFKRVERRMAPLSRELSGLILPHEHFGSHLNSKNETVDGELEKRNFQYAGETLAEVWSTFYR
ncbi:hypothetical protein Bhyg_12539 [Pseudolycoriella hygida]|uniref:Uncharacterized protein n=1 Tax=Pseudolycoriella hygida TaxID=35572 RepID=A0A9Q0MZR9_9DIPT|nr:hypothetical protein Bhyg_12539 [Pseudolycoriella hygida]